MKTLRQLREETTKKNDLSPTSGSGQQDDLAQNRVPSSKEMPTYLTFRRLSYRMFPDKQVVALYYSKQVDKYLSIPFGPGNNLNMSEAKLDEVFPALPAIAAGAARIASAAASSPIVKKLAGPAGKALQVVKNKLSSNSAASSTDSNQTPSKKGTIKKSAVKTFSSLGMGADKAKAVQNSVTTKKQTAALSKTNENKMTDIRKMVAEGIEFKTLKINDREVTINTGMAKRILEVYDSVNSKNKKIVENMLNDDLESFKKLLNFTIKN
jgi:hypothetical protein